MDKQIIYAADPMCSWCYGFAPVITQLQATYGAIAPVSLILGGLYAGNRMPLKEHQKRWVLHHWEEVHRQTGQPFNFEFNLPAGFIYDTEPACRAVVVVRNLKADIQYLYFSALQRSFYVGNRDLTQADVLVEIAADFDVDQDNFLERFTSLEIREETQQDFTFCRRLGIDGFPAVLLKNKFQYDRLNQGYREFTELKPKIDAWLAET